MEIGSRILLPSPPVLSRQADLTWALMLAKECISCWPQWELVGVRFRLPVVSVGIDVAQALTTPAGSNEPPGPRLHLNFSPKL